MKDFPMIKARKQSVAKRKLVCGVGANNADYIVEPTINGRQVKCPFYVGWKGMLARCYSQKYHAKFPTYVGCSVVDEWHSFMTFRAWMIEQPWEGNDLDKDILVPGNKIYGPDFCVYIDHATNALLNDHGALRGPHPIGVVFHKQAGRYMSQVRIQSRRIYLGLFDTPEEAHSAWRKAKSGIVWHHAKTQTNERVELALKMKAVELRSGI